MKVINRMCSIPSTSPSPLFYEDKLALNTLCLKSLLSFMRGTESEYIFVLDNCDLKTTEMVKNLVPQAKLYPTNLGIDGACRYQYEFVKEEDDTVFFTECDYLFLPDRGAEFIQATKELGFVSPYDHPDKYPYEKSQITILGGRHWKTTLSTTSTFAAPAKLVLAYKELLTRWGYIDHERWVELNAKGERLFSPIPSMATHMVTQFLSPAINWERVWQQYL